MCMHVLEINIQAYIRREKKINRYIYHTTIATKLHQEYDLNHKTHFTHICRINHRAWYTTNFKLQKQINFEVPRV